MPSTIFSANDLTPHITKKTATASLTTIIIAILFVTIAIAASATSVTHTTASTIPSVVLVVHTILIIVTHVFVTAIAAHDSVKVASSASSPVTAHSAAHAALKVVEIVHAVAVFLVSSALVADIRRELTAAVAPTASVAGTTHDLGSGSKVVVDSPASPVFLHVPQETASSHAIANSELLVTKVVHVLHIVRVTHHAPASAVAHHAIPHSLAGHASLQVFDLVHAGTKIVSGTATSAVDIAAVISVDRILHGATVLGEIDSTLVAVVHALGVLSGSVLEVSSAVVKVLASVAVIRGSSTASSFAFVRALRVFAAGHEDAEASGLGGQERRNRHECLGGSRDSDED
mmetsp:Transcript_5043/g.10441  ORF Transcript_5043/g.10441 Transcript_5043/m.10441 type:complete len:345 (+) Transcript_5043:405-1439(+)